MIVVCPLDRIADVVDAYEPSHVVSLLGEDHLTPTIPSVGESNHLKLSFNDVSAPTAGCVVPDRSHIETLVNFIEGWEGTSPMAFHCLAGVSRSTAGAFIALCILDRDADEMSLARKLRKASPSATPNKLMVALADDLLGRNGRMSDAVAAIGRGAEAWEGNVFHLALR